MKRASKKLLIAAVSVLLTALMFLAMPLAVMAKSTVTRPTALTVMAYSVQIDPADADYAESQVYEMEFWANGSDFSSFAFSFRMPAFVQVQDVVLDSALDNLDSTVFTWYEKDGVVNTAYSSADNVSGVRLFNVSFTVNDYTPAYCAVECVSADFVDIDLNRVAVSTDLGFVQIGEVSFSRMGDVDANGVVDLADLLIIQRSMVNPDYALSEQQYAVADIDKNGDVTILDCQYIQNYLVGRIDSLENIGGGGEGEITLYSIKILIMDENRKVLFDGARSAAYGEAYDGFMTPIFQELSAQYEILGNVSIYSDVYGTVDPESNGEGFVVTGNDQLTMVVKAAEKERAVQYTFTAEIKMPDGSVMLQSCTFYTDGTALFVMEMVKGDEIVDNAEQAVEWIRVGEYIDVIIPEIGVQRMFIVNKDGSLSAYESTQPDPKPEPPMEDHIVSTSSDIQVGVVVGSNPELLVEKLCQHTFKVVFSQSGEHIVQITPDMINYANVNFDEIGEYEVEIHYFVNGREGQIRVDVYVIEDKSDVEVLGVYDFPEGEEKMGVSTLTVYAGGTLQLGEIYQTEYQEFKDNVVIFSMYGEDFVISLDARAKTASYYKPTEELIGRYVYDMGGGTMFFEVYGKYEAPGYYVTVYGVDAGEHQMSMTTRAYLDMGERVLRHAATPCDMIFDENNVLSENHQIETRTEAPTCDRFGYEIEYCVKCDSEVNRLSIAPLGHQFDENGICGNCGKSEKDDLELDNRRGEILKEMQRIWRELREQYGDRLSAYEEQYNKYYNEIENAREMGVLDKYLSDFHNMVEEIHRKLEGGMTEVFVNSWHYVNEVPFSVWQGGSVDQFMNDYLIGNTLMLQLSDGTAVPVVIDGYMISTEGNFDMVGPCWIYIHVAVGNINHTCDLVINVTPDMSDVASTTYRYTEAFNGWGSITVYGNGMLEIFGQYYSYTVLSENDEVTVIRFHGNSFYGESVLALNRKDLTASFYQPDGNVIGQYTLRERDNEFIYTVYGERAVSGDFVVVVQRKLGDGQGNFKQEDQYTTALYCNFEESFINTVEHGMLTFDEEGNLFRGEIIEPEEPDYPEDPAQKLEQYRDQIKDEIKMLWSEIDQGDWEVSDEQYAQYNDIMDRVYTVSEAWQLDELRREAEALCKEIKGIVEVESFSQSGIPQRVVVGTTMEEFFEMLSRAKVTVYYTNGTSKEYDVTADMLDLGELDLNEVGAREFRGCFALDGEIREFYDWIEVIENKAENAKLTATYDYVAREAGADGEWYKIELYDNGYALLFEDDGVRFVEYQLDGNILVYHYNDERMLCEVIDGKNAMTAYCPKDFTKYSFSAPEWGMMADLHVFSYNEMRFAYLLSYAIEEDGTEEAQEMTCVVYFNADGTKIRVPAMDDMWFEIGEGNELIPCECEHLFDENGRCEYCGDNVNGDEQGKDDYVDVKDDATTAVKQY